ncbi:MULTISPECIES: LCP family protein [Coprobacillaceae]|uniref:LCP family protein n=1 Tax=Coprobacillaceae TaxID=2810280 RepID=UPI001F2E0B02|nr:MULTISPECIES: LCP family protein [Coprobacillaceae]
MAKHKKKGFFAKLLSKRVLLFIQLIMSIIFLAYIYILKMLPTKYYMILVGVIVLLFIMMNLFIRSGIKRKRKYGKGSRVVFSKLLCLIISVVLGYTSVMIAKGNSFLSNITGSFLETRVISIYAMNDSSIKSLDDLKGETVGIQSERGTSSINNALSKAEDKLGSKIKTKDYKTYAKLGDALVDGKVKVIVVDQAYMSLLETHHDGLDENLRSLFKVETKERINNVMKDTNVTKKPFIVYVTGIDTYGTVSTISRTDVNLLVCVSPVNHQILMVSIPRDTEVNLHKNGKMDKLTHSAMYGIDETISTIQDFLELDVNYYAKTNFSGITNIIDALGGVTIDSPYNFTTMHGHYRINKGLNELNGDQALCFVRERYALPRGDFDRGQNQQRLLKAMIKKALSPQIITNYNNILSAVEGCFETNMASDDIKALVNKQIDDGGSWQMFNVQVSGEGHKTTKTYSMPGQSVYTMVPDEKRLNRIIEVINKIEADEKITKSDVKGLQ